MVKILLVEDDLQAASTTKKILELEGYSVSHAADGLDALSLVRLEHYDAVLSDVRMPKMGGLEFLKALNLCKETTPVVLMTAFGQVEDAVWAMKLGAVDFLTKPFNRQTLVTAVKMALDRSPKKQVNQTQSAAGSRLLGKSQAIETLRTQISQVAPTPTTVLITGESGTGKELVAQEIHKASPRKDRPFLALNCAAIPENLMESELFGHEKGSFSGAHAAKVGLFEAAQGGTLFLDEIGELPLSLQPKLLRVLQESEIRRVGSPYTKKVDVRVLSATNRDLAKRVSLGAFREDLLFRLEVIRLDVPALRDREQDVLELADIFLREGSSRHGKLVHGFSQRVLEKFQSYFWPGNVRELQNVIERALVFAHGSIIDLSDLPTQFQTHVQGQVSVPFGTPLKEVEELLIRKTLEATEGDKTLAAQILGINSRTIYRKLSKDSDL